jgi:hypothetical protein
MNRLLIVLVLSICASVSTRADEPTGIARDIIESQINAFLLDDVGSAYSFASPGIQNMYPDPNRFMEMVRSRYSAIYRPGHIEFGRSSVESDGAMIIQEVLITSRDGRVWQAIYMLQRQQDGSYRISGVQMRQTADTEI